MTEQPTDPSTPPADSAPPPPPPAIPEETLNRAFGAFKKRHKLTKLDQESKLGASRPMTSGKQAGNIGILPPNDYGREVWRELARLGKIKDMGGGFYSMP